MRTSLIFHSQHHPHWEVKVHYAYLIKNSLLLKKQSTYAIKRKFFFPLEYSQLFRHYSSSQRMDVYQYIDRVSESERKFDKNITVTKPFNDFKKSLSLTYEIFYRLNTKHIDICGILQVKTCLMSQILIMIQSEIIYLISPNSLN